MGQTKLKIGNAQGFWGDTPGAALRLYQQQPDLDYITLDYLAEVSMSILAIQREKEPSGGYAKDFLDLIASFIPYWKKGAKIKIIANAGGLNPQGCANACLELLRKNNCSQTIGVVAGDDVLPYLQKNSKNKMFQNLETKKSLFIVKEQLVTANAYLGSQPIAEVIKKGATIIITGRVADPCLTVGPCLAHFNWRSTDYNLLAAATVAGHLLECGTQATGGISTDWLKIPSPEKMGFPFVEIEEDGNFIITKPKMSGGAVTVDIIKEQLLYEIGDPENYLSPDVTVSFLGIQLRQKGKDCVQVTGCQGKPSTDSYKVSATFKDGFKAEGQLAIFGQNAKLKAQRCGDVILKRVQDAGYILERTQIDCIGCGAVVPGVYQNESSLECLLRIAVADHRKEALECFSKEIASLVTSGPQGVTGYTSGRPHIRPVFGYWPCLIEKKLVEPRVAILKS